MLKGLSVGQRLLLLTVLPLFVITTLLTSYMIITRQTDREEMLSERGSSMTHYLAGAAEVGLFAGDFVTLKRLANTMLEQEDVHAVRFFDSQGALLLVVGGESEQIKLLRIRDKYVVQRDHLLWVFQAPAYYHSLDVDEFDVMPDELMESRPVLGWIQLVMDEQRMRAEQQMILFTSIFLGALGFVVLFLLAGFVARGISRPISSLTRTVRALGDGQLAERSGVKAKGELGELARGINSLASSVETAREDLNARVAEATGRLTGALTALERRNEQLESAREELESASAVKGDFLARMSHELRTPLTAVSGYAKLLQSMSPSESQEEYLNSITGASKILLSTIDDILDFTRLESGVVTVEALPFCLEDALEDVLTMHALTAHKKQLELVLLIEPDVPPFIVGDALRLRQVLTNLISNALKFTNNGQVVVSVSLESLDDDGAVLFFSVKDTGIGISESHQVQLFDAFSQANQTITRRFGGTGLGLAISKELTRLMGGDIHISSQPGQGTDVAFSICCDVADESIFVDGYGDVIEVNRESRLYVYEQNSAMSCFLRSLGISVSSHVSVNESLQELLVSLDQSSSLRDVLVLGLDSGELRVIKRDEILSKVRERFAGVIVVLVGTDVMSINALEDECARFGPIFVRSKPIRRAKLQNVLRMAQGFKEGLRVETAFDLPKVIKSDRLHGSRILVAEDNDFNRHLICAVVEAEGGEVIGVRDGVEALREISANSVDLVLMDLNMPRLDGRLAVRELRRGEAVISTLPVIALTAEVFEDDDHGLLEEGFDRALFKPLDEVLLIDTIVELLAGSDAQSKQVESPQKQSFLSSLPAELLDEEVMRQLKLLDTALQNRDFSAVRGQAHQLRSVLYGLEDADEVVLMVGDLEQACVDEDLEKSAEIFAALGQGLSRSPSL